MSRKTVLLPWEKYQHLSKQNHHQPMKTTLTSIQEEEAEDDELNGDMVIESVPKNVRTRARALLGHIKNDGRLTWNQRGEISYGGQTIPGSHITDLVKDSQYKYKHFKPVGHDLFYQALRDMNIPRGLIGHHQRMEAKKRAITKTPPGIRDPPPKKKKKPVKWLKF